jgi:hypothetical protein
MATNNERPGNKRNPAVANKQVLKYIFFNIFSKSGHSDFKVD